MATFRSLKQALRSWLKHDGWSPDVPLPPELSGPETRPMSLIAPLIACLPEGGEPAARAALALGLIVGKLSRQSPEDARTVLRRFIWQMNEESGNIGWGIPEAFGASLAHSRPLADQYHSILFNYINNKEGDSTYCDHAPLRRSCFNGIAMVLEAWPALSDKARPLLEQAAERDEDETCRTLAREILRRFST